MTIPTAPSSRTKLVTYIFIAIVAAAVAYFSFVESRARVRQRIEERENRER